MTDRAVSITVNFALSLVVATLLMSALLMVTGNLVDNQQDQTVRTELRVVGERLAASLMSADRLAQSGAVDVIVRTEAPNRVGGTGYEIEINATPDRSELILEPDGPLSTVRVYFVNETPVEQGTVDGGDMRIVVTDDGTIGVESDD